MEIQTKENSREKVISVTLQFFENLLKDNLSSNHEIFTKSTVIAAFCLENTKSSYSFSSFLSI